MELDQQATFDMLREALGDFGNTPLGEAALSAAKGGRKGSTIDGTNTTETASDDPRPRYMRDANHSQDPPEAT